LTALALAAPDGFTFGPFVLFHHRQLLFEHGAPVRIGSRAMAILYALVTRAGEVVGKRQLMAEVWPGLVVDEGNLKVNVAALRRALGEYPDQPRYIATVVGRGYRFIMPVAPFHPGHFSSGAANMPTLDKPIFGRQATIAATLVEMTETRLLSIVGPGGIGKTTLALAVAHAALNVFEHGVWFVDLASVNNPSQVADAIATSIGAGSGRTALHAHLRDRNMMVVLDNAEHLIDAVASCADEILTGSTHLRLLVTSREPLCIRGERVRRLAGLGVPPASQISMDAAMEFAAVQLFVDRAKSQYPTFALTEANASIVGEICRRLDGLALAIERMAMRAGTLEIGKMLDHLDRRFHMLDGYHEGPERHRTLTAAIAWSYDLLSASEQSVMCRLSIFDNAFSLESACIIGATPGTAPESVVEDVAALAAKSLLSTTTQSGAMQYRMTNIARAFALDTLLASGSLDEVRLLHAAHRQQLAGPKSKDGGELNA